MAEHHPATKLLQSFTSLFTRILLATLITAALVAPQIVRAHDGEDHKGKETEGQVISIGGDRFELKTAKETLQVTFSSKTKFQHDRETVDKTHLTAGEHVTVIGTKLPSGEMVAKEVMIGNIGAHSHASRDHSGTPHPPHAPPSEHHK